MREAGMKLSATWATFDHQSVGAPPFPLRSPTIHPYNTNSRKGRALEPSLARPRGQRSVHEA